MSQNATNTNSSRQPYPRGEITFDVPPHVCETGRTLWTIGNYTSESARVQVMQDDQNYEEVPSPDGYIVYQHLVQRSHDVLLDIGPNKGLRAGNLLFMLVVASNRPEKNEDLVGRMWIPVIAGHCDTGFPEEPSPSPQPSPSPSTEAPPPPPVNTTSETSQTESSTSTSQEMTTSLTSWMTSTTASSAATSSMNVSSTMNVSSSASATALSTVVVTATSSLTLSSNTPAAAPTDTANVMGAGAENSKKLSGGGIAGVVIGLIVFLLFLLLLGLCLMRRRAKARRAENDAGKFVFYDEMAEHAPDPFISTQDYDTGPVKPPLPLPPVPSVDNNHFYPGDSSKRGYEPAGYEPAGYEPTEHSSWDDGYDPNVTPLERDEKPPITGTSEGESSAAAAMPTAAPPRHDTDMGRIRMINPPRYRQPPQGGAL